MALCHDDKDGKVVFSKEGDEVRAVGRETIILKAQSGVFPNVEQLYPKTVSSEVIARLSGKKPFKIALSVSQLLNVIRSTDEGILKFAFYGGRGPVEFEIGEVRGMIMPMDINGWE